MRAETLDARGKIGIVVGLGGGVNHAVGVGHRFGGLVDGFRIGGVVLAVGIVVLIVIRRVAADGRGDVGAVVGGHASALVAIGRVEKVR